MKKLLAMVLMLPLLMLVGNDSPAQASPGAYAYVQHINKGWVGPGISVKCHTNGVWYNLGVGQHSRQFCGQNGWVDALDVGGCAYLTVRNISTGQIIQYGNGYHGYGPPGGSWDAWVTTRFPNPC